MYDVNTQRKKRQIACDGVRKVWVAHSDAYVPLKKGAPTTLSMDGVVVRHVFHDVARMVHERDTVRATVHTKQVVTTKEVLARAIDGVVPMRSLPHTAT